MNKRACSSIQNVGVGLRAQHFSHILKNKPKIAWFEILSDNYLMAGGEALNYLEQICARYPIAMHSVGMSLGSTDPLNWHYFDKLQTLANRIQPGIISDHLCWNGVYGEVLHELLPLPYTEECVKHVAERIRQVQDFFGRQILIENVSSYLSYTASEMTEWEFLMAVANEADCHILLDINNIVVSASNHHFLPNDYLNAIAVDRVKQFHLSGYDKYPGYLFDAHGREIQPDVWDLYAHALARFGEVPTLVEWDTNVPEFDVLFSEAMKAKAIIEKTRKR